MAVFGSGGIGTSKLPNCLARPQNERGGADRAPHHRRRSDDCGVKACAHFRCATLPPGRTRKTDRRRPMQLLGKPWSCSTAGRNASSTNLSIKSPCCEATKSAPLAGLVPLLLITSVRRLNGFLFGLLWRGIWTRLSRQVARVPRSPSLAFDPSKRHQRPPLVELRGFRWTREDFCRTGLSPVTAARARRDPGSRRCSIRFSKMSRWGDSASTTMRSVGKRSAQ